MTTTGVDHEAIDEETGTHISVNGANLALKELQYLSFSKIVHCLLRQKWHQCIKELQRSLASKVGLAWAGEAVGQASQYLYSDGWITRISAHFRAYYASQCMDTSHAAGHYLQYPQTRSRVVEL